MQSPLALLISVTTRKCNFVVSILGEIIFVGKVPKGGYSYFPKAFLRGLLVGEESMRRAVKKHNSCLGGQKWLQGYWLLGGIKGGKSQEEALC